MIDLETQRKIVAHTKKFWEEHVKTPEFIKLASGKEIGHRIADYVDDKTVELLRTDPDIKVRNQVDVHGEPVKRSMGDLWIYSNGMHNPVNIKSGVNVNGNPNVVSIAKLIDKLISHQIDSYYLLIIKSPLVEGSMVGTTPQVFLIDLLDYLDFINFDAGPGQTMLKEKVLYAELVKGTSPPQLDLFEKVKKCMDIMEDGYERLLKNREAKLAKYRNNHTAFEVADIKQDKLSFG